MIHTTDVTLSVTEVKVIIAALEQYLKSSENDTVAEILLAHFNPDSGITFRLAE